jgi:GNAT superfamily N-acetyltransferase
VNQPVVIRPATAADIASIEDVLRAHDEPPAGAPPFPVGAYDRYLRHLLARGTVIVADAGGAVIGFGASVDTGRAVHLADLFVLPDALGEGIGRRLVEPLFPASTPRTTFASDDPRAMHLYVGLGMTPLWPNFYLDGRAAGLPMLDGVEVVDADVAEVAELELAWTGLDRSADYERWAERPGNRSFVVRVDGRTVAAGDSRPRLPGSGRWLHRLIPAPETDPVPAILAAMRASADEDGVIGACVMGPNPALRTLLVDCGFRIVDRDTFMATDPALLDPRGIYDTGIP